MNVISAILAFAQFAPAISKLLTGKTEELANTVINIAKDITNEVDEKAAFQKIKNTPHLAVRLEEAVLRHERDIETAIIRDRESARNRDISIIKAGRHNKRADIMVIAAALGLIVCLGSIAFFQDKLPGEAVGIISTIAGIFGSCLKDAYNFEFGSSRGSKEKDQTVASIINKI